MNNLSNTEKIALGERLTLFRNALRMTQQEFGKAIGKGRTTIFSWEKGKTQPPEHYMEIIERATWHRNNETIRINPHWLRTGEGDMFVKTFTGSTVLRFGTKGEISGGYPPGEEPAAPPRQS